MSTKIKSIIFTALIISSIFLSVSVASAACSGISVPPDAMSFNKSGNKLYPGETSDVFTKPVAISGDPDCTMVMSITAPDWGTNFSSTATKATAKNDTWNGHILNIPNTDAGKNNFGNFYAGNYSFELYVTVPSNAIAGIYNQIITITTTW